MIKATKILHKEEYRIKVDFPYDQATVALLQQIEGAKWSRTHKAWHIPYTKEAFAKLKSLFADLEIDNPYQGTNSEQDKPSTKANPPENPGPDKLPKPATVLVEVVGRKIILKMPKNDLDVKFILTLRFARWDKAHRAWLIPNYPDHLPLIKEYFKDRIAKITVHQELEAKTSDNTYKLAEKDLLCLKTEAGRLKIIFGFNKTMSTAIKKMPFWSWDSKNKWWTVPFSDKLLAEIQAVAAQEGLFFRYEEEKSDNSKLPRKTEYDVPNYRPCPEPMLLKLRELRYSEGTIKAYKSLFEEFINHYPTQDIDKIDEPKIVAFCQYLVIDRKVSASYQNQAINAIKFY
jgi:hypothetical protein